MNPLIVYAVALGFAKAAWRWLLPPRRPRPPIYEMTGLAAIVKSVWGGDRQMPEKRIVGPAFRPYYVWTAYKPARSPSPIEKQLYEPSPYWQGATLHSIAFDEEPSEFDDLLAHQRIHNDFLSRALAFKNSPEWIAGAPARAERARKLARRRRWIRRLTIPPPTRY